MNIEHISVSRHSLFKECSQKYKFKYHLKQQSDEPEKPYFAYGKIIHKIAEEYVDRKDPSCFSEIVTQVLSGDIEIEEGVKAPRLDREYQIKMLDHLKSLKDFILKVGMEHEGHTEYHFKYDLQPPNQFYVTGFIDRIIIADGKYFILDYKTTKKGSWRKNEVSVLADLQLRLYANVVCRDFNVTPDKVHCCLYYIDGSNLVGARFNESSLKDAEKELLETYIEIKDMDPESVKGNVGEHCRRCEYRKICPFWSLT